MLLKHISLYTSILKNCMIHVSLCFTQSIKFTVHFSYSLIHLFHSSSFYQILSLFFLWLAHLFFKFSFKLLNTFSSSLLLDVWIFALDKNSIPGRNKGSFDVFRIFQMEWNFLHFFHFYHLPKKVINHFIYCKCSTLTLQIHWLKTCCLGNFSECKNYLCSSERFYLHTIIS